MLHSRQNSETFDILHAFLSLVAFLALVVAKLSDLKKQSVYFWPTLYYYYYYYLFFIMIINIITTTTIIVLRHIT